MYNCTYYITIYRNFFENITVDKARCKLNGLTYEKNVSKILFHWPYLLYIDIFVHRMLYSDLRSV
jgi:hypothetical protein